MNISIIKSLGFVFALLIVAIIGANTIHKVDATEWQVVQHFMGEVEVKDTAGPYFAVFPKITEYDRNISFQFTKDLSKGRPIDESTRVTFNDGGTAQIDVTLRISLPTDPDKRREFHRQFNGNTENIRTAVWSHLSNVIKTSGPLMTASENQASRKGEFNAIVFDQLNSGMYEMARKQKTLEQTDQNGKPIIVFAT